MRTKTLPTLTRGLLASAALLALSACAATEQAKTTSSTRIEQANKQAQVLEEVKDNRRSPNVKVMSGIWLGETGVKSANGEPLPAKWERPDGVSLTSTKRLSLVEIGNRIGEITGIRVRDTDLVLGWNGANEASTQPTAAAQNGAPRAQPGGFPAIAMQPEGQGDAAVFGGAQGNASWENFFTNGTPEYPPMEIAYPKGALSGLLNLVANNYGIDWEYRGGVIRFIGKQTRSYTLYALDSDVKGKAEITNKNEGEAEGDGASSTTSQTTTSEIKSTYWNQIEKVFKSNMPNGVNWQLNRNSGTLTVTARPSVLSHIEGMVRAENERLGRQVAIAVKVLSINVSSADAYNLSLTGLFKDGGINLALGSVANAATGTLAGAAGSLTTSIVDSSSSMNGSNAIIQALSQAGQVSLVTSANITTLNNQTAPVSVVSKTGYLKSIESTISGDVVQTSLTPGSVSTGFTMSVTPRIFNNGEMVLNYAVTLSELNGTIKEFGPGENKIQIPDINSRSFLQSVKINSGETLVLAGFERNLNSVNERGTGSPSTWLLGGGTAAENNRELVVILMTPVVIDKTSALRARN